MVDKRLSCSVFVCAKIEFLQQIDRTKLGSVPQSKDIIEGALPMQFLSCREMHGIAPRNREIRIKSTDGASTVNSKHETEKYPGQNLSSPR